MNDPEALQRKLTELDLKLDLLTKRMFAPAYAEASAGRYVTTILQILHNPATQKAGRQGVVGFREMLHYLNQNEKDFSKTPASSLDREFIRLMKPLWPACRTGRDDDEWGNSPLTD